LPGIHFVTGTVAMPGPIPVRFSRNMTIVREEGRLILVNSVRLGDAGLAALDRLGKVTDILRLAANHGMDDPFYRERYGAKVWAVAGQRYTAGFDTSVPDVYFEPDVQMDARTPLPLPGARLHMIASQPPEALLLLERHGGTVVSGDCLQHWAKPDACMNLLGRALLKLGGFMKPHNIGPGWLKQCNPPKQDLRAILDLAFANVLTCHGAAVIGDARELYRPAIDRVTV
jgi:hypothetical protein